MSEECSILFHGYSGSDPKDEIGCLKEAGHFDYHIFRTEDGRLIAWEYDVECKCGCWNTVEEDCEQCMVFWEIKSIE